MHTGMIAVAIAALVGTTILGGCMTPDGSYRTRADGTRDISRARGGDHARDDNRAHERDEDERDEHGDCRLPAAYQLPQGDQMIDLDPRDFSSTIDNPYWPMALGTTWTYHETDTEGTVQLITVTVTGETKTINGIEARVVHDVALENGVLVEDTFDWYAQDSGGSIWYLGEDTKSFENGQVVSTAGSWEYGIDNAQAGVIVPADPEPGCSYRQEYYAGQAEDNGTILSTDEFVQVPAGSFRDVLTTADTTPLEPWLLEHKFYARGVGPALVVDVSGATGRSVLVDVTRS